MIRNIGIVWQDVVQQSDFSLLIKALSIEQKELQFLIHGSEAELLSFRDYPNIHVASEEEVHGCDLVFAGKDFLSSLEKEEAFLLSPLSQMEDKKTYLGVFRNPQVLETTLPRMVEFLSLDKPKIASWGTRLEGYPLLPTDKLFDSNCNIVLMEEGDFEKILGFVESVSALMKARDKKGLFSSIGNYFFKNYIHHPEQLTRKSILPSWSLLCLDGKAYLSLETKLSMEEWKKLIASFLNGE